MNLRPLVVTGPIGSGKSTVSKLLESFGAVRVDLDQLSNEALASPAGLQFVKERWPDVVNGAGIERASLAKIVFGDPTQLRRLERFVHPLVVSSFESNFGGTSRLVVEVSVPFSITIKDGYVLLVDTPRQIRVERLLERGMFEEDISARMAAQPERARWLALADVVVSNNQTEDELSQEVEVFWARWSEALL